MSLTRRDILVAAGGVFAASAVDAVSSETAIMAQVQTTHADGPTDNGRQEPSTTSCSGTRAFNGVYRGEYLNHIAFPMGGIGAGMICLEGTGALTKFSLRNQPDLGSEPRVFSAISIRGLRRVARVLEGPVPAWKLRPFFPAPDGTYPGGCWGLPRFRKATFETRFPFGTVRLKEAEGPSDFDQRFRWVTSFDYQLPVGKGQPFMSSGRAKDLIFGGWHLGGIFPIHSGFYFTPEMSFDPSNTGSNGLYRTDQVCNGNLPRSERSINNWFDINCFPLPAAYTFGGKNILEGPGAVESDLSLRKVFDITESKNLEFRFELFNAFNHPVFAQPDNFIDDGPGAAGTITSTVVPQRQLQFALKLHF
jgi:glycosyl hydrolase family 116 (putative beta-glucocerebrosidase)